MGGRCAQDIAGAVIPVNGSGCPLRRRVVQRIRDVRQVNITVAVRHHHFGGDRIMTHKYCGIHRCGGVLVVVILCGHGGNVVPGPSPRTDYATLSNRPDDSLFGRSASNR